MAKSEPTTIYEWVGMLVMVLVVGSALLLLLDGVYLKAVTKEQPLPNRIIGLPAPSLFLGSIKTQAEAKGFVVYAKEPASFKSVSRGSYIVYGDAEASQALNASVAIYARAKDPGEDPACKVFTAPLAVRGGVVSSPVYVCEEGQNDIRVASAKFVNAGLSPFSSRKDTVRETHRVGKAFARGRFWMGIGWSPLFPHPLAFRLSNMTICGPSIFISCTFASHSR
jgi:hypothetical protein